MDVFTAASHHDVLVLIIQVAILLVAARGLGEVAQRLNQPAVVGEIMAGILLGPTLLSGLLPFLGEWIVPQTQVQGYLLEVISLLGALFLLVITGLETDIPLIKRHARSALGIAAGGLILPFATGYALASLLPDTMVANPDQRLVFNLFVATAMSISAIPVIAKVLMDLNLIRRDLGQTILAAGMVDDTTAWILLSVVLGLASGQAATPGGILSAAGKIAAFMVLSFTLGRWIVRHLLNFVQDRTVSRDRILTLVVVVALIFAAIAQAIEIEAVLGAFVAGIIFGTLPRLPSEVVHQLEAIALGIFAPVFFGVAGLKVDVISLLRPELMLLTGVVLAVAVLGKLAGAYAGGRLVGLDHWNSFAIGSALNARGAVEIIIATIGLSMGILTQDMYSIVVVMAMATSLMAPSMLKWSVGKIEMGEEEQERLNKEQMAAESQVAGIHRVLIPVRRWADEHDKMSIRSVEAQIIERLGRESELSVTLMTVIKQDQERAGFQEYLRELSQLFNQREVITRLVEHEDATTAILQEAEKDYDLVVLGASQEHSARLEANLFNPLVDDVVRMAPCATMVVQAKVDRSEWRPRRLLVPTNGTRAARDAAEFAFYIANGDHEDTEVVILNVALRETGRFKYQVDEQRIEHRRQAGEQMVAALVQLGEAQRVNIRGQVVEGDVVDETIVRWAESEDIDLILLGTDIRPGSRGLYFGAGVEKILADASCPVVVVNV